MSLSDNQIITESDVEQKFIYSLLTNDTPIGLGYVDSDIRTKHDIRKIPIDKGIKSKLYFPDYAIVINGLPLIIVEAKSPEEDIEEAIREARLYATELNAKFRKNVNPCSMIIVSNAKETILCSWDSSDILAKFEFHEMNMTNQNFDQFIQIARKSTVTNKADIIRRNIRRDTKFVKPLYQLGGKMAQGELVGENSFGSNLSLEYKYLFNPEDLDDRTKIAKNAYVSSKKKLAQVQQMDKIIRKSVYSNSNEASISIRDTSKPKELIDLISSKKKIRNEVCILIGSVGAGKSTFTDYLREVALPDDIKNEVFWANINFNNCPASREEIYPWVISELTNTIRNGFTDLDLDDLETLKRIFTGQLKAFRKGPLALFEPESMEYKTRYADKLTALCEDKTGFLKSIIQYLIIDRNKLLITVFDNCDKRDRDTQLLLFEVANWLKANFICTIMLPMRDSTFDNYRKEPPLDTVIKDLTFRIEPPLLDRVIYQRFSYALREMEKDDSNTFHYYTSNNIRIACSRNDVRNYLQCILTSLFQNKFFKRLITGLAGRDIRKGLEIFLDFCKSGHISEDEIFKMRQAKGDYILPNHIISRIFLRGSRRFYSDEYSIVKNLFHSYHTDDIPDPFVRHEILVWLKNKQDIKGPNDIKGFHKLKNLVRDLQANGHTEKRIIEEIVALNKASCIVSESHYENIDEEDLIAISSSGIVHLDLLKNLDYLSSVAEDTYFREPQVASKIAENMTSKKGYIHMSKNASYENANTLINYLMDYKNYFISNPEYFLDDERIEVVSMLDEIKDYVNSAGEDPYLIYVDKLIKQYPVGSRHNVQIVSIQPYGLFVEMGLHASGYIHASNIFTLTDDDDINDLYENGDWIEIEVTEYSREHHRFHAKIV